ncbi:MarR family winged helix-turn-helix transcriptional regulator [Neobacillus sp. PS3-34]|uniref:MarR family winged helix-turn-helix transcriptional regulator n=1 Tax=Neobacillus sp. PS3-34 TaxID=3070678 RepID=UPI0027E00626|nr:MarR family winged helix-turn-helix transcriptional regulator [Neobacillus sp. PS3-34]WML47003.1 MarR family winged helix-turn-helix transcriptional regulator [Neobacillus sp. PS3-34]
MEQYFCQCLYFTANHLARLMNKMAEEEFAQIGLSPTYAFLLMAVKDRPGITQSELSNTLHIAPSTTTRFVDKLEVKKLVERKNEGKLTLVFLTEKGIGIQAEIKECWKNLSKRYSDILGPEAAKELTNQTYLAAVELEKHK